MAASLSVDGASLLELLTPLYPAYFLPLAGLASVGKNVGYLAAAASRAALHQALCSGGGRGGGSSGIGRGGSNLGDVTAKAGAQSTLASLAGTGLGLALVPLLGGGGGGGGEDVAAAAAVASTSVAGPALLAAYAVLAASHQYCTYQSLRSVALRTLSRHRLNLVLEDYVQRRRLGKAEGEGKDGRGPAGGEGGVLSPAEVVGREWFVPLIQADGTGRWLTLGAGIEELFPGGEGELGRAREGEREGGGGNGNGDGGGGRRRRRRRRERYLIGLGAADGRVRLTYLEGAGGRDVLRGMLHAHHLAPGPHRRGQPEEEEEARRTTDREFEGFVEALEGAGWDTGPGSVRVEEAGEGVRLRIIEEEEEEGEAPGAEADPRR